MKKKKQEILIKTSKIYHRDIEIEFGREKYSIFTMKTWKSKTKEKMNK